MSEGKKAVINRGKRILTLKPGPDGKARLLEPGKSIDCLDEAEFNHLTRYSDIADVEKIVPQVAARSEAMRKQIQDLEAENARLKSQQAAIQPEQSEEENEETETAKPKRKKAK